MAPARKQHGQAMVEFALVFPVFILMLFGVLDFGRMAFAYNTVAHASRQASRLAMVQPSATATIRQTAQSAAIGLDPAQLTVSVTYPDGTTVSGSRVQVSVDYRFYPVTPIITRYWGSGGILLRAVSTTYAE
ncbi:MAG: pilus assembly protein [Chloroflexi bacterium]|nr:pilus assembly protein [Chloroflexota bacterium]